MHSRKLQALAACAAFTLIAILFGLATGRALDEWRVAFWSMVGVTSYIVLSHAFGFDPQRTRIAEYAPALVRYVDRWELRQGQATLSMLGVVALLAGLIDPQHFVTAVVCGTLAAWSYFMLRLYSGAYTKPARAGAR
jgi:hypothetical protein